MCGDCQRRADTNPLRVLDCKVRGGPADHRHAAVDSRSSVRESAGRTSRRCSSICAIAGSTIEVRPRLVRGLDYYMRTTFEVVHGALGAQNSVLGGGRYDGLAESLGSKVPAPGIGFSIGEDRLVMSVEQENPTRSQRSTCSSRRWATRRVRHAARLARELRRGRHRGGTGWRKAS